MTQVELIDFLKNNLKVIVTTGAYDVNVSLYLGDEKISESSDELNFVRNC